MGKYNIIFIRSIPLSPDLETDSWHQIYCFRNEMNILQLEPLLFPTESNQQNILLACV